MKKLVLISLMFILSLFLVSCGEEKIEDNVIDNVEDNVVDEVSNEEQKDIDTAQKINDEMKSDIEAISEKLQNGEMTDEEAEAAMLEAMNNSSTVQSQLDIQKEQMPKLLKVVKESRKCFEDVDNKSDAEECIEESEKLAKKLGIEEFYSDDDEDFDWNQDEKEEMLIEMDEGIAQMEKTLPCILNAKVLTDMMECSMGDE